MSVRLFINTLVTSLISGILDLSNLSGTTVVPPHLFQLDTLSVSSLLLSCLLKCIDWPLQLKLSYHLFTILHKG
jgi:hypothetical protein